MFAPGHSNSFFDMQNLTLALVHSLFQFSKQSDQPDHWLQPDFTKKQVKAFYSIISKQFSSTLIYPSNKQSY